MSIYRFVLDVEEEGFRCDRMEEYWPNHVNQDREKISYLCKVTTIDEADLPRDTTMFDAVFTIHHQPGSFKIDYHEDNPDWTTITEGFNAPHYLMDTMKHYLALEYEAGFRFVHLEAIA